MSEEIGLIYISLSQLLDDICVFLRDGVTKEAFAGDTKKQAETLIRRSKTQLQQISNLTNGECYMQMENETKKVEEEEEEDLIYMDAEEHKEVPVENNLVCPFASVPAKSLALEDKHGFISLKTRLILRIEKWKKIFAAIQDDWFLIYCNDRESKPCYTYCLRIHRAKKLPTSKQSEFDTPYFGLVNLETDQMLQFEAQTHKDMIQWVTRINRYHQHDLRQLNKSEDPPKVETVPVKEIQVDDEEGEHYDTVILKEDVGKKEVSSEEEEIYEVIRPPTLDKNQHIPIPKPSEISTMPKRRQLTPLPPLPVEEKRSSESLASYDDLVTLEPPNVQQDNPETLSFSEDDDEDNNYDVLVMNPVPEQDIRPGKTFMYPTVPPKKIEAPPTNVSSMKKLLEAVPDTKPKKERPIPPKKLIFDKKISTNNSPTKENQLPSLINFSMIQQLKSTSPGKSSYLPSPNHSPISPNGKSAFAKPIPDPKPSVLTKPKIDVKIIKSLPNTKSTKQVMRLAKEISMK